MRACVRAGCGARAQALPLAGVCAGWPARLNARVGSVPLRSDLFHPPTSRLCVHWASWVADSAYRPSLGASLTALFMQPRRWPEPCRPTQSLPTRSPSRHAARGRYDTRQISSRPLPALPCEPRRPSSRLAGVESCMVLGASEPKLASGHTCTVSSGASAHMHRAWRAAWRHSRACSFAVSRSHGAYIRSVVQTRSPTAQPTSSSGGCATV